LGVAVGIEHWALGCEMKKTAENILLAFLG
jgi:hypothetical protein